MADDISSDDSSDWSGSLSELLSSDDEGLCSNNSSSSSSTVDEAALPWSNVSLCYESSSSSSSSGDDEGDILRLCSQLRNNDPNLEYHQELVGICDRGMELVAQAMEENEIVTSFEFSNNELTSWGQSCLARMSHSLTSLTLADVKIDFATGFFDTLLSSSSNLEELQIQTFRDHVQMPFVELCTSLEDNTKLLRLGLCYVGLTDDMVLELSSSLWVKKNLQELALTGNRSGGIGARALAYYLEQNTPLSLLDLSENGIGTEGVQALALALKEHNRTLKTLNLAYNTTGHGGFEALADALKHNSSLSRLDLKTKLKSVGQIAAFASALGFNDTLEYLDVTGHRSSPSDVHALALGLQKNKSLSTLNMANCGLQDVSPLANVLLTNTTLKSLNVSGNDIRDDGLTELLKALETNHTLRELDLSSNLFTSEALVSSLAASLTRMKGLEVLGAAGDLSESSDEAVARLVQAFENNSKLRNFTLYALYDPQPERRHRLELQRSRIMYCLSELHRKIVENRSARDHADNTRVPLALWPFLLERVGRDWVPEGILFHYLVSDPQLFFHS